MDTKLHIRLLAAENTLLGWAEVMAYAKGDGQLWVREPVMVTPDVPGMATAVSVQWVDVNVEVRTALPTATQIDRPVTLFQAGPIFRVGPQADGLPPVTVKSAVVLGMPVGALTGSGVR